MLCYVMLCYVMLHYIMTCCVMSWCIISFTLIANESCDFVVFPRNDPRESQKKFANEPDTRSFFKKFVHTQFLCSNLSRYFNDTKLSPWQQFMSIQNILKILPPVALSTSQTLFHFPGWYLCVRSLCLHLTPFESSISLRSAKSAMLVFYSHWLASQLFYLMMSYTCLQHYHYSVLVCFFLDSRYFHWFHCCHRCCTHSHWNYHAQRLQN